MNGGLSKLKSTSNHNHNSTLIGKPDSISDRHKHGAQTASLPMHFPPCALFLKPRGRLQGRVEFGRLGGADLGQA